MASPVKPTFKGSIPIGLTGVTKLWLSSGSFRSLTDVYKSKSIGSTGDHKCRSDQAINGVLINQPTTSLLASSVQPAFKNRSGRVSGELHRRNQPAFKPYASDRPVLKKIAGPTCHICVLCGPQFLLPPLFRPTHLTPPPLHSRLHAAFPSRRRRSSTPPPCTRAATTDVRPRRSRTLAAPP